MPDLAVTATKLRTAVRLLGRRAYVQPGGDGPTRAEQGVLAWLDEQEAMSPSALAAAEKVRPQTMGQTLDALSDRGWIQRAPHPADRRQILISLSPAGREELRRVRSLRQDWLVRQLSQLELSDQQAIANAVEILERIAKS